MACGSQDSAALLAEAGGVINLTSTAASNSKADADSWHKFHIAGNLEEGANPTASLGATGEGSQINIHFGAFTGAYGSSIPNHGAIYLGTQNKSGDSTQPDGSKGTVYLTAADGGSVSFDDQGKSAYGRFVESWAENTYITATNRGAFSANAMYSSYGTTTILAEQGSTVNFGADYYSQAHAATHATVDGVGSKMTVAGMYSVNGSQDVYRITNGGEVTIGSYYYMSSGSRAGAHVEMDIIGSGSRFMINDATYGLYNLGGEGIFSLADGGSMEMKVLWNTENSSYPQYQTKLTFNVSGVDESGVASRLVNTGSHVNYAETEINATNGGQVSIAQYNNTQGATSIISVGVRAASPEEVSTFSSTADAVATFEAAQFYNSGDADINVNSGGEFSVGDYFNEGGNTVLNVSEGGAVHFNNLLLTAGSMTLQGSGEVALGSTVAGGDNGVTYFYVGGDTVESVTCTSLDVSGMSGDAFSLTDGAEFTLVFTSEQMVQLASGSSNPLELTLITGYNGTALTEDYLSGLLGRTSYLYQAESTATPFAVQDATYELKDGNLVWKGVSSVAVPEPATATLSLLALAGLAARRRRK